MAMFLKELSKVLPTVGIGVASCALLKTIEAGWTWCAAFNGLFLGYCIAVVLYKMR